MRCYLDYNASAPIMKEVKKYLVTLLDKAGNPSSIHTSGRLAKNVLEIAREDVAHIVNAKKENVIFTSGATEANNLALNCFDKVISSNIEHDSIRLHRNIDLTEVNKEGVYDLEKLENKLKGLKKQKEKKILVSAMFANNETGIIQPIKKISEMTKKYNICFHTDAVQAVGRVKVDMQYLSCDMITLSSHKIGGPMGSGALVVKNKQILKSMFIGGAQEESLRAGTEPLLSLAGFGRAARLCKPKTMEKIKKIRDAFEKSLINLDLGIVIIGKNSVRLPNTFLFSMPSIESQTLLMALDLEGFEVSTGAACSSGQIEPSKTLKSMGLSNNIINSSIRVSLGSYNTMEDVVRFNYAIKKISKRFMKVVL